MFRDLCYIIEGDIMAKIAPAKTLEEAYRYLNPLRPLQGEWLETFYVERPPDSRIDHLLEGLRMDISGDDKTLFSGQQGAGETTELNRLSQELQDSHILIFFSAEEMLNLGDIHYTDLLVLLGLQVYRKARAQGFAADDQKVRDLLVWYEEYLGRDEIRRLQSEVNAEINLGVVRFGTRLAQDAPFRARVRNYSEANLSDLLTHLNDLLTELHQRSNQHILVIVDGLDKIYDLRRAAELFLHGANALIAPACRIIYTVPFPLFYSHDFQQVRQQFHRNFLLPNVKVQERNGAPYELGREMLRQVLLRRVQEELITREALEALVEASGGLLRELLHLARLSVLFARNRKDTRITLEDVESARREVRNTFRRILKAEDYENLWKVYEGKSLANIPPEAADRLLHNLSILEYDGEIWWDVHPAVRDLLESAEDK